MNKNRNWVIGWTKKNGDKTEALLYGFRRVWRVYRLLMADRDVIEVHTHLLKE